MTETLNPDRLDDPTVDPVSLQPRPVKFRTPFPSPVADVPPLKFPESLFPDAEPDTEPSPDVLSADEVEELQTETEQDAWDRYNDAELLGKSFRVRRIVQETGTQAVKGWKHVGAKVRNAFATPGKAMKQHAYNRARSSYQQKLARHEGATSDRVLELVSGAKNEVERRKQKLDRHTEGMRARVMTIPEDAKVRRQEYNNHLKIKREATLSRKAVHTQLRSEGVGRGESRRMTKDILEKMPIEFRHRLGNAAIVAEVTRRKFIESRYADEKATGREKKAGVRVAFTERRIAEYDDIMNKAQQSAVRISTELLPNARARAAHLEDRLGILAEGDPEYVPLSTELAQARTSIARYESELQRQRDATEKARKKSNKADGRLGELQIRHERHNKRAATATEQRKMWRDTNSEDQAHLHGAVQTLLKPPEETDED